MLDAMPKQTGDKEVTAIQAERRRFLRIFAASSVTLMALPLARICQAMPNMRNGFFSLPAKGFVFAQLVYDGGNWDPEPEAWPSLAQVLEASTSIDAEAARRPLRLLSPELFRHPFLYMAGDSSFQSFQDDEIAILRRYLKHGGTLVGDDCGGTPGHGFDASFRREMGRIFPESPMERLPSDHTVYRSFFLIRGMGGRNIVSPFLEGVNVGAATPVIYSPNGLAAAWSKNRDGGWRHTVSPGGERQRQLSFQTGINLIMYAMCGDYKKDRIHLPFLRMKI
jgi:hypothetical protein